MDDLVLGVDSATPFLSLALWSPTVGVVAELREQLGREHARRIVPALEELFASGGRHRHEVTAVACGIGPGSYTGLRIGLATAAGLSRALGVPLAGCDTLAAMAFGSLEPAETGIALLDARRGNVYTGVYRRDGDDLRILRPPAKLPRAALPELHPGARQIEGVAPDPGFIARSARAAAPAKALYL